MRTTSPGHAIFATVMAALGVIGFITGDFVGVWGGAPESLPGREALPYLCAAIALLCGAGLFFQRTASFAARALLLYFLLWLIAFKAPFILRGPLIEGSYQTNGETAVIVAGAWLLYTRLASDWDKERLGFIAGETGVRIARVLFGLSLIAFGLSHFVYTELTAPLVPHWLGWPVGWAYFTGGAYLAAGAAVLTGILARLAAALTTLQMGLFGVLIWIPMLFAGPVDAFRFGEVVVTFVLTASAWVVTESYASKPWFAVRAR